MAPFRLPADNRLCSAARGVHHSVRKRTDAVAENTTTRSIWCTSPTRTAQVTNTSRRGKRSTSCLTGRMTAPGCCSWRGVVIGIEKGLSRKVGAEDYSLHVQASFPGPILLSVPAPGVISIRPGHTCCALSASAGSRGLRPDHCSTPPSAPPPPPPRPGAGSPRTLASRRSLLPLRFRQRPAFGGQVVDRRGRGG